VYVISLEGVGRFPILPRAHKSPIPAIYGPNSSDPFQYYPRNKKLRVTSGLCTARLLTKIVYEFLISRSCDTSPVHLIHSSLITSVTSVNNGGLAHKGCSPAVLQILLRKTEYLNNRFR